jgi:ketosteroid isomerase-like protein
VDFHGNIFANMKNMVFPNNAGLSRQGHFFESTQARQTRLVIESFFTLLRAQAPAEEIAALFSVILAWEVPQKSLLIPWSGVIKGRAQIVDFIHQYRALATPKRFSLVRILVEGDNAIAMGELDTVMNDTGEAYRVDFAFHFTVREEAIVSLRIYETTYPLALVPSP